MLLHVRSFLHYSRLKNMIAEEWEKRMAMEIKVPEP